MASCVQRYASLTRASAAAAACTVSVVIASPRGTLVDFRTRARAPHFGMCYARAQASLSLMRSCGLSHRKLSCIWRERVLRATKISKAFAVQQFVLLVSLNATKRPPAIPAAFAELQNNRA